MNATGFEHVLERHLLIRARPETVFRYFTDSKAWASWWGAGSAIDPRPGGRVVVRYPNGTEAGGEVIEIDPPRRIVFSYGYASGTPIPLGASRVTIRLIPDRQGTRLELQHALADPAVRDQHVQGWRYQLSLFANVVASELLGDPSKPVDAWFAAWSEPDASRRHALLASITADQIRFKDRFSHVEGRAELEPHLAAVHVHMPGIRLERVGAPRHCQGTVVADWIARGPDGTERGRGTNVFEFDADGRIEAVVGIWS
jgi:uncharacterized protein YndB with AHSA1/START domain